MADIIEQIKDKSGNNVLPITHVNAVRDSNGDTLPDILDRDYPTTSKTPVEDSTEVSLVTRGEKYEWNKVGNATDATGASDITSTFKYLLLNGTTGEFETALKSYVEESVRAALGSLINNLNKGTGLKAVAGIDNNNDLGSATLANLASMLSAIKGARYVDRSGFTMNKPYGLVLAVNTHACRVSLFSLRRDSPNAFGDYTRCICSFYEGAFNTAGIGSMDRSNEGVFSCSGTYNFLFLCETT